MSTKRLPPVAAVIGFIDSINRGDIDGLGKLMTEDHELVVFGEEALRGRARNTRAWAGYAAAYPDYVIYPHAVYSTATGQAASAGESVAGA
jgi:ketosteroid isomerase-like protein